MADITIADMADIIVTGSSGFIGSHLCQQLTGGMGGVNPSSVDVHGLDLIVPKTPFQGSFTKADIADRATLASLPRSANAIIHLAAKAEVVIPFHEIGDLSSTNVNGTTHVLDAIDTSRFIFASSSAVYGTSGIAPIGTAWSGVNPIGTYGMTKAMGELICGDWARQRGGVALMFRFGNVVGKHCRGFIPYLVNHAKRFPDGSIPAQARGQGRIVRDYVPVDYTVKVLMTACHAEVPSGTALAFNIGTGRPQTNAEVASIVQQVLAKHGYKLNIEWDNPIPVGESHTVVLDPTHTAEFFGLPTPSADEVIATIEEAVVSHLTSASPTLAAVS